MSAGRLSRTCRVRTSGSHVCTYGKQVRAIRHASVAEDHLHLCQTFLLGDRLGGDDTTTSTNRGFDAPAVVESVRNEERGYHLSGSEFQRWHTVRTVVLTPLSGGVGTF